MKIIGFQFYLINEAKHIINKCMSVADIRIILDEPTLEVEQAKDKYLKSLYQMFPEYDTIYIFPLYNEEDIKPIKIVHE